MATMLDLVPGEPRTVKIVWSGKQLTPMRPTRRFKRGEREPEQCEVLDGTLLLRDGRKMTTAHASKLAAPPRFSTWFAA
jgi:hypothetical protein